MRRRAFLKGLAAVPALLTGLAGLGKARSHYGPSPLAELRPDLIPDPLQGQEIDCWVMSEAAAITPATLGELMKRVYDERAIEEIQNLETPILWQIAGPWTG